jgi:hypothetical protein
VARGKGKSGRQSGGSRWVNPGNPFAAPTPPFNPFRSATTDKDVVIEVINGKPTVVAIGGKPTYGPDGATQSNWLAQNRPELVRGGAGAGATSPPSSQFNGYTPDSIYNDSLSTIAANRRRALDAATEGEKGLASDFGLGITQDDTGAKFTGQWAASDATRGGIDPSNPFSRASLLNQSYFTAGRIGEGSYANRGLLTSGAYQRSQQRDAFRFESGKDQLLKQFASGLQSYRDRRSQAESDAEYRRQQASTDLFGRNRDNYDRTNPS